MPTPQEHANQKNYREYKVVKNTWNNLQKRYLIEKYAPKSLKELTTKKLQESEEGKLELEKLKNEYMLQK